MITWWVGRGVDHDVFRALFPAPDVKFTFLGADSQERTLAALADGTAPDIVMIPRAGTFAGLARRGLFADLSGYGWTDRLLPVARALGSSGGRLYGLPRSSETMLLLYDRALFASHDWRPPVDLPGLEALAAAMQARGIVPFGAGAADVPASVELYFSLVVNHHAGPARVREALAGRTSWVSFRDSVELLRSWFERGWFGESYFTDGFLEGFGRIATGEAGMSPNMTWVFGDIPGAIDLGVAPFPSLGTSVPTPLYLFGTGSLLAVNAASPHPDAAAAVLERLFTNQVRRDFSRALPGDWNLPLNDPDVHGMKAATTPQFASTAIALTEAAQSKRFGYSTWSFFPPRTEEAVIAGFRDMVEGRLPVDAYLGALDAAFDQDRKNRSLVELP